MTAADYGLAEAFKRATVVAVTGSEDLFGVWFTQERCPSGPPERPYAALLVRDQGFDPEACAFLEVDRVPVGAVHLVVRMTESGLVGHVNNYYLAPEWRGRGLGERLDGYAMGFFAKHGVEWATLRTDPKVAKLIGFYERMGWRVTGEAERGDVWMGKAVSKPALL